MPVPDARILDFAGPQAWAAWLAENHAKAAGAWLRLAKKSSPAKSVTYAEALEEALCHGWIDGQKKPESGAAWLQKFVPRSDRSIWSKINREKAEALIAENRMKPAGMRAIERAKENGQWDSAYDSPSRATVPDDLAAALDRNPRAKAFFATLDGANRYAVLWRVQTARKPETRARRIEQSVDMLARGETIHPQKSTPS